MIDTFTFVTIKKKQVEYTFISCLPNSGEFNIAAYDNMHYLQSALRSNDATTDDTDDRFSDATYNNPLPPSSTTTYTRQTTEKFFSQKYYIRNMVLHGVGFYLLSTINAFGFFFFSVSGSSATRYLGTSRFSCSADDVYEKNPAKFRPTGGVSAYIDFGRSPYNRGVPSRTHRPTRVPANDRTARRSITTPIATGRTFGRRRPLSGGGGSVIGGNS